MFTQVRATNLSPHVRFKKSVWRKTTPKGLKMKKFVETPDGTLIHDHSFVGEDAWNDDTELLEENVKDIIDNNVKLKASEKKEIRQELGIQGYSLFACLLHYPYNLSSKGMLFWSVTVGEGTSICPHQNTEHSVTKETFFWYCWSYYGEKDVLHLSRFLQQGIRKNVCLL